MGIVYTLYGYIAEDVAWVMGNVLEVMRKYGVKHNRSSVVLLPPLNIVDAKGNPEFTGYAVGFPAFDVLRASGTLHDVAKDISAILGNDIPVMCADAASVAYMNGKLMG